MVGHAAKIPTAAVVAALRVAGRRLLLLGRSLLPNNDSDRESGDPPEEDADFGIHGGGYYHTNLTDNTTEPASRKKGLTVTVSVLRLPAA